MPPKRSNPSWFGKGGVRPQPPQQQNEFLNAEMAAEVYVLPKFTPTQITGKSSLRDGQSSLSHAPSNRGSSTPHAAMAAALEVEADGEYPSCGIVDFGNVMDQDPGFFDDLPTAENGSEFPVGPDDNSTIHAASASDTVKPSGKSGKSGMQCIFSFKKPKIDAKTVSFHSNRIIASQCSNLIAPVPGIHHR
jgi:hypothetical protein